MNTASHFMAKLEKLKKIVEEKNLCGVLVESGSSVFYFTGYSGAGHLLVTKDRYYLLVPVLEYLNARDRLLESGLVKYIEEIVYTPYGLPDKLVVEESGVRLEKKDIPLLVGEFVGECAQELGVAAQTYSFYAKLQEKKVRVKDVSRDIMELRAVKEPWEIERITMAARITEEALTSALTYLDAGVSESELAGLVYFEMIRRGADGYAFPPIVAFNENSVYPHATPSTSRVLWGHSVVLFDIGAKYEGYSSDMTRTTFFGTPSQEFKKVAEAVLEAMEAALETAGPDVKAGDLDSAARRVLEKYGYAKYFIHSLGHGLGIDVHEPPRLSQSDETVLRPGMIITIEPGVYIPGKFGVRIEDTVLITERGATRITRYERVLW